MRLFIAIDCNEIKDFFVSCQDKLPKHGKFTFPEEFHITLKFLGEVDDAKVEEVVKLLKNVEFEEFTAKTKGIGFFVPSFLRVVFVEVPTPDIFELQKMIDEALLPMFPKEKKFESHVTLARIKYAANKKDYIDKIQRLKIDEEKFQVKDFLLVKSTLMPDGPIYETVERYPSK